MQWENIQNKADLFNSWACKSLSCVKIFLPLFLFIYYTNLQTHLNAALKNKSMNLYIFKYIQTLHVK